MREVILKILQGRSSRFYYHLFEGITFLCVDYTRIAWIAHENKLLQYLMESCSITILLAINVMRTPCSTPVSDNPAVLAAQNQIMSHSINAVKLDTQIRFLERYTVKVEQ